MGGMARQSATITYTCIECEAVPRRARRFEAHRPVYHSTLGLRVTKKKKRRMPRQSAAFTYTCGNGVQGYLTHKKTPPHPRTPLGP